MTPPEPTTHAMRWQDYVLIRGAEFDSFWAAHAGEAGRRVLLILGRGFDPRTTLGLLRLQKAAPKCQIDVVGLEYVDESANHSAKHRSAAETNWDAVRSAITTQGSVNSKAVEFRTSDGRRVAARSAANAFANMKDLTGYTDVVVDISAMPRVVYFPLISRLIYFYDELMTASSAAPNIHVILSEDPEFDMKIVEQGIDETASFLHPFEGPFNREAKGGQPAVWIPVLGEGRATQLDRIYDHVKPNEVCPVLPSPARDPRRGDNIVMEYRELLFDQLRVEPRNFIYASELNPFDVYRQVRRTALHYNKVLKLIGGCRVALSTLCSKFMSLGVLLVAYELKSSDVQLGIAHIECQNYELPLETKMEIDPVGVWLAGECYRRD